MNLSIVNYHGKQSSTCGYCKGTEGGAIYGLRSCKMTAGDYQDLMDRGWRRSGNYCYKPDNAATCCPSYTIKCDAQAFQLSKSQKKVLKRMNHFLREGDSIEPAEGDGARCGVDDDGAAGGDGICDELVEDPDEALDLEAVAAAIPSSDAAAVEHHEYFDEDQPKEAEIPEALATDAEDKPIVATSLAAADPKPQAALDGAKPLCKKAKQIRLEYKNAKLAAKGIDPGTVRKPSATKVQEKTLRDYVAESENPNNKHTLVLKMVNVKSKFFANSLDSSYAVFEKYQTHVHNDPPKGVDKFIEFLKVSPLNFTSTHNGPATGYGSFHQQYWLDGKLIAVAVIDILPRCISSVYFFYDPDYRFLSLGTYASLRELHLVQDLCTHVPAMRYYYMGYYIHSCPKMRYKGKLQPSYLLCPETYTWHPLGAEISAKLKENKYQRLHSDPTAKDANEFLEKHLDAVLLLMNNNHCITYLQYTQSFNLQTRIDKVLSNSRSRLYREITDERDEGAKILEYGRLVGKTCAHRMLYFKFKSTAGGAP